MARGRSRRLEVDAQVATGLDPEHRSGIAAVDRDREVAVRVLVQDQVARTRVRERARGDGVVPLGPGLQLDARARDDPDGVEV
jgi:hypothetical protein